MVFPSTLSSCTVRTPSLEFPATVLPLTPSRASPAHATAPPLRVRRSVSARQRQAARLLCSSASSDACGGRGASYRKEEFFVNLIPEEPTLAWEGGAHPRSTELHCKLFAPVSPNLDRAPLLVLHGGPGVPHNYLLPLAALAERRPVMFFDQVGCGGSGRPPMGVYPYGIAQARAEVNAVLDELSARGLTNGRKFHLYGQSWGGILAWEWLMHCQEDVMPLSLTLSNSPASVPQVEEEANALVAALASRDDPPKDLAAAFYASHECTQQDNPDLREAKARGGAGWRGSGVLGGWTAVEAARRSGYEGGVPALVIGGDLDFVTPSCLEGWRDCMEDVRYEILQPGGTHMPFLEPELGEAYLNLVGDWLEENDRH